MDLPKQIARHFREIYFGGNWTGSNFKDNLADVTWNQATAQVQSFNTIATLVFHTGYYVSAVLKVFEGGPLEAHDKFSFDLPPVTSQEDWEELKRKTFDEAEKLATLIEQLPEAKLWESLAEEKYGNYYRNINGIINHTHYHLGQIALLKKLVKNDTQ
jgi:uncharacterized damage-inducible protein DinB